jgi:hypothetical protein
LRYVPTNGFLSGDTNGDGVADFQVQLVGIPALTAGDILL